MKSIKIADGAKYLTIEDCMELCAMGVEFYFQDGRDLVIDSDLA